MKNFNKVRTDQIIDTLSKRLPHIPKNRIKIVYHLFQREIKIALVQSKVINILGFAKWKIAPGYVKKFFHVFHKEIRNTVLPTKISTKNYVDTLEIKKFFKKGETIEDAEDRGLRKNQRYAYKTAQRAFAKIKQNKR